MARGKNPFTGDGERPKLALIVYQKLRQGEWVSYESVLDALCPKEKGLKKSVRTGYDSLKKAFSDVLNKIKEKCPDSIEQSGRGHYRYVGEVKDPLGDYVFECKKNDFVDYWNFCQDSVGFFPEEWVEYFLNTDDFDFLNSKKRGKKIMSTSGSWKCKNIEYLPLLYKAISNQNVLAIKYKPFTEAMQEHIFHPQYLKEYNGRWHLIGHSENYEPHDGFSMALDRIVGRPLKKNDITYIAASEGFYEDRYKSIVGLTVVEPVEIRVRAHAYNIYMYFETKKLHDSQSTVIPWGIHEDGEYAEFSFFVGVNNEFIGRILQMGEGLEIVSPQEVRDKIKIKIANMNKYYLTDV